MLPDAFETVEAPLPAVVTVSNELGEPRYPKLQQIMQAGKKPVTNWAAGDLGVDAGALAPKLTLEQLFVPVVDTKVELMEGESPEEQAGAGETAQGSEADSERSSVIRGCPVR